MKKIAFVVQRCGDDVVGGSEAECLEYAKILTRQYQVEILTTCAKDYMTWEDFYPEGEDVVGGVSVRRFPVAEPRDVGQFNKFSEQLFAKETKSLEDCETWMQMQGPNCPSLLEYLSQEQEGFHRIIFFTYLYATTYYGVQRIADPAKLVLVPTAHDEGPAHLPIWTDWYRGVERFIFNTAAEKRFLERHLDRTLQGEVIGMGPKIPDDYSGIDFRQEYDLYAPYLLYVGRIDITKGAIDLADLFIRAKEQGLLAEYKLVFIGAEVHPLPDHADIISCGFVSERNKYGAIEDCELLVNPSPFESLSIVLLEAWLLNKPVLVNGQCEVMVDQIERFSGGFKYTNLEEFSIGVEMCQSHDSKDMDARVTAEYGGDAIAEKLFKSVE